MVSTELSVAVLVADTVLYGFMIAYYAISLGLRGQEKSRIPLRSSPPGTDEERDSALREADAQLVDVFASAASGDLFLLGCTLFAVPSAILGVAGLLGAEVPGLLAVVLFLVFLVVVAAGMAGVAVQDFRQNMRDARGRLGAGTRTMDILNRGMGKR